MASDPMVAATLYEYSYQILMTELSHRQLRVHPGPDKLRWGYRMSGKFTIHEAFHLARGPPLADPDPFWKKLWEAKL